MNSAINCQLSGPSFFRVATPWALNFMSAALLSALLSGLRGELPRLTGPKHHMTQPHLGGSMSSQSPISIAFPICCSSCLELQTRLANIPPTKCCGFREGNAIRAMTHRVKRRPISRPAHNDQTRCPAVAYPTPPGGAASNHDISPVTTPGSTTI